MRKLVNNTCNKVSCHLFLNSNTFRGLRKYFHIVKLNRILLITKLNITCGEFAWHNG